MKEFLKKNGTRSVFATVISILVGLFAGSILVLIVGLSSKEIGIKVHKVPLRKETGQNRWRGQWNRIIR